MSYRNFGKGGHLGYAANQSFYGANWDKYVTNQVETWRSLLLSWLRAKGSSVMVVHYEDLKTDMGANLERIVKFLNLDLDPARVKCVVEESEGSFHRKPKQQFDPFNEQHRALIKKKIEEVNVALKENNHPELPVSKYEFF